MSQGLFSNRILATNRQKKNHCCQVLHVHTGATASPASKRHLMKKMLAHTSGSSAHVRGTGHTTLTPPSRTNGCQRTLKLRRSSELAPAAGQNRGQSRATKPWRHTRARPDAEGKKRRWDYRRRIGEAGGMATPMITRLASLAEYVVVPGAILVAYFTTRGSAPVKKESRK